jgi:hypothetical protein
LNSAVKKEFLKKWRERNHHLVLVWKKEERRRRRVNETRKSMMTRGGLSQKNKENDGLEKLEFCELVGEVRDLRERERSDDVCV